MSKIREIILCLVIISIGALFGGSLSDSIVLAPNFRVGIPQSLEHLRQFMAAANPGSFFRFIAPLAQTSTLVSLMLAWKRPAGRKWWLIAALLLIVAAMFSPSPFITRATPYYFMTRCRRRRRCWKEPLGNGLTAITCAFSWSGLRWDVLSRRC
jgi:hypothetical protein